MDVSIRDIGPLFDILDDGNLARDVFAQFLFVLSSRTFLQNIFQACVYGPNTPK